MLSYTKEVFVSGCDLYPRPRCIASRAEYSLTLVSCLLTYCMQNVKTVFRLLFFFKCVKTVTPMQLNNAKEKANLRVWVQACVLRDEHAC